MKILLIHFLMAYFALCLVQKTEFLNAIAAPSALMASNKDIAIEYLPVTLTKAIAGAASTAASKYNLATTVFNAQAVLGDYCNGCKSLKYYAFRQGKSYMTAFSTFIRMIASTTAEPTDSQLFQGFQNIDGSWAFKSKTQNKFIRADANGATIDYQTYIGPWERWWIERHYGFAHCHIQSAQFAHKYWVFNNQGLLMQNSGAQLIIMQYWPEPKWGWN